MENLFETRIVLTLVTIVIYVQALKYLKPNRELNFFELVAAILVSMSAEIGFERMYSLLWPTHLSFSLNCFFRELFPFLCSAFVAFVVTYAVLVGTGITKRPST